MVVTSFVDFLINSIDLTSKINKLTEFNKKKFISLD